MSVYDTNYYSTPVVSVDRLYGGFDEGNNLRIATRDHVNTSNNTQQELLTFQKDDVIRFENYNVPMSTGRNLRTNELGKFSVFDVTEKLNPVDYKLFSDFTVDDSEVS